MKTETRWQLFFAISVLAVFLAALAVPVKPTATSSAVQLTILQMNDVYEMTPVSGGTQGGLARVATVRKQLLAQNPNTIMILAGDLVNPSALGTATVNNERLNGKQMVAAMNEIGLDYTTLGNHEFDLNEANLFNRLKESRFKWISSNVFRADGTPLPNVSPNTIFTISNSAGVKIRVGLFGLTLNSNPVTYVQYKNHLEAAKAQAAELRPQVDVLIAITHLPIEEDFKLAEQLPQVDLIIGGHEHENMYFQRGAKFVPIAKADANARTVYIHEIGFDTRTKQVKISSRLQPITSDIPDDPAAATVIRQWLDLAFTGFKQQGFNPEQGVATTTIALDGLEANVRNQPTELAKLIAKGMLNAAPNTELAIFNGGSIRIDDVLPAGKVTEYDVIRILPFGGIILSAEIKGTLLKSTLDQGLVNKGNGGYLQTTNVELKNGNWFINGEALKEDRVYKVAINDFLLTGREQGLNFLNRDNKDVKVLSEHGDIRRALIDELKRTFK